MASQCGTILAAVLAELSLQHYTLLTTALNVVIEQSFIGKRIGSSTARSNDIIVIIML